MDENQLEKAMQLISISGNAKSDALRAILSAEKNDFDEADSTLQQAKKSLHEAHVIQTQWMTAEMNGEAIEKSILLIHSQDHFMSANIMIDVAERMNKLMRRVYVLEQVLKNE